MNFRSIAVRDGTVRRDEEENRGFSIFAHQVMLKSVDVCEPNMCWKISTRRLKNRRDQDERNKKSDYSQRAKTGMRNSRTTELLKQDLVPSQESPDMFIAQLSRVVHRSRDH